MEIMIGSVIQKLRKIKGFTQEQVAGALGVSKSAVSKWESGSTYPDIVLLAPLSRLLDTNVNELLAFNSCLNEKELNNITVLCEQEFLKGNYLKAYEYCEHQLQTYPNNAHLKLAIGSVYWQYLALLKDDAGTDEAVQKRICLLFEEASQSSDYDIREGALYSLSSVYLGKEDYEGALKVASRLNAKSNDTMLLQATIYRSKGDDENARIMYQRILCKNIQTCTLTLQSLARIAEKEPNIEDARFFLETAMQLDVLFETQNVGGNSALQLAELYAGNNNSEQAIEMLKQYVDFLHFITKDNIKELNKSRFFSKIPFRPVSNEKSEFLRQHMVDAITSTPVFDTLKDNPGFRAIIEELKNL